MRTPGLREMKLLVPDHAGALAEIKTLGKRDSVGLYLLLSMLKEKGTVNACCMHE